MEILQKSTRITYEDLFRILLLSDLFLSTFVTAAPTVSPGATINVIVNSSVSMTCLYTKLVNASDSFQIIWNMGGKPQLVTDKACNILAKEMTVLTSSCPDLIQQNLTILRANLSFHDTTWTCQLKTFAQGVRFDNSDNSVTINVIVPVDKITLTEPGTETDHVTEGSTERFVCKTSPCRPPATVIWYRGGETCGKTLIIENINTTYISADNDFTLTMSTLKYNVTRVDQGCTFYCEASNNASREVESTRRPKLNVWYSPTGQPVIHGPIRNNYTLAENMTLNLTCDIEGGNPLATLTWNCNAGTVRDESSSSKTIQRVTWIAERGKDGPCTCTANHPTFSRSRSDTINVEVLYPPSTPILSINGKERKGIVKVINNTDVPVTCNSSSKPPPTYKWLYKKTEYIGNMVTPLITENATLTCIAANKMTVNTEVTNADILGNSTAGIRFHVLYGPTKPILYCEQRLITGQTVDVIHGHSLSLTCSANGDPPPQYTWNGSVAKNITVVITRDDLVYSCTASNKLKPDYANETSMSESSVVRVNRLFGPNTKPLIKYNDTDVQSGNLTSRISVVENSSFSLTCNNSNGRPPPTYKWTGAGRSNNGLIDVSEIKRSPSLDVHGMSYYNYTCVVQNEKMNTCGDRSPLIDILNHDVTVNVLYPAVLEPHQNQSAEEGKDVFLTATVAIHGSPRETYSWLYSIANTDSKTALAFNLTHTIQNISRTDAGLYTIEATNVIHPTGIRAYNRTVSQTFYLDVFYTTTISNFTIDGQQGNTTYNENDTNIEVRCHVDSNPSSDIEVYAETYNYSGKIADKMSTFTIVYTIPTVTCFDTGTYRCMGHNNYTRTPVSSEAHIFVRCTPRPRYLVNQNITVYKGLHDPVTLNLSLIAYPEPSPDQFYWEKINGTATTNITNGGNVNISVVNLEPSLTIHSLQQTDFGQYRLMITDNISRLYSHYFFINPQDKPQAPTTFTHIQEILSATTAGFQWTPGFDGGLNQIFYVYYKKASDLLWNYTTVLRNKVTLTGLVPGTLYNVKVFASNRIGNSSETNTLNFTTKEELVKSSSPLALIGGAAGGGVCLLVIFVVVLGVIFYRRTYRPKDSQSVQGRHSLCNDHAIYDENGMEINQAYESADSLGIQQPSTSRDVYAQVDKSRKTQNANVNDNVYAVVDKRKKKDNDATVQMDVYATPVKGKIGKKGKKGNGGKKKGKCVHEDAEEMNVYSNVGYENEAQQGNVYVNAEETRARKKNMNKDGLLYADIAFEKNNKGQRKLIIHGQENATEYIQVDFTKRANPLPDSDEEEDNF